MREIKHWSKMQERGTYLGMLTLLFFYRIFGRRILFILLYPVVIYLYFTGGQSKKASRQFLSKVARQKGQDPYISHRQCIAHFYSFAQSAFDKIDAWAGRISASDIVYSGQHPLQALAEKKQGAIFIGSHLGNLEVCRALGQGRYHTRINVLVFTHHAVEFNKVLKKISPDANVDLIQATDVSADLAILIKERIDNGEILVITGDRTSVSTTGRVIYADFLGEPAPFSQGPFILASILNCPVYFLYCIKQQKKYQVIFEHVADSLKFARKDRDKKLNEVVKKYAKSLEKHCLVHPLQWFNFFNFWQNDNTVERGMDSSSSTK